MFQRDWSFIQSLLPVAGWLGVMVVSVFKPYELFINGSFWHLFGTPGHFEALEKL